MSRSSHSKLKGLLWDLSQMSEQERLRALSSWEEQEPQLYRELKSLFSQDIDSFSALALLSSSHGVRVDEKTLSDEEFFYTVGDVVAERYLLLQGLGRGGSGIVFLARDQNLHVDVALKFILIASEETRRAFLKEVRLARQITHPLVCRVFDINEEDRLPFFSMEYIAGEDLHSSMQRVGPFSPNKVLDIAKDMLEALRAAHAEGILHRDIKPSNVILDREGRAHLTDFGLALDHQEQPNRPLVGTLLYMAPEQWVGLPCAQSTDIFSFGAVLYELLTGQAWSLSQREQDSSLQVWQDIRDFRWPVTLHPAFKQSILHCLCADPTQRPQDVEAVLASLPSLATIPVVPQVQQSLERVSVPPSMFPERRPLLLVVAKILDFSTLLEEEGLERGALLCGPLLESWETALSAAGGEVVSLFPDMLVGRFGFPTMRASEPEIALQAATAMVHVLGKEQRLRIQVVLHVGDVIHTPLFFVTKAQTFVFGALFQEAIALASTQQSEPLLLSSSFRELLQPPHTSGEGTDRSPKSTEQKHACSSVQREALRVLPELPFVGRTGTLKLLLKHWERTCEGEGHSFLLVGEAGGGKTRLLQAVEQELTHSPVVLSLFCTPETQDSPLGALALMFLRHFQLSLEQNLSEQVEKMLARLRLPAQPSWFQPLLGLLALLPFPDCTHVTSFSPGQVQRLWFSLYKCLSHIVKVRPVCWLVEDVHWIDSKTHAFFEQLLPQLSILSVMVVMTSRPGRSLWGNDFPGSTLKIRPLSLADVQKMSRPLLSQTITQGPDFWSELMEKTGGVPLFVEEALYSLQPGGDAHPPLSPDSQKLPFSLQHSFLRRLEQLGEEKMLIQRCAVLGYEFREDWIAALWDGDTNALSYGLERLIEARVLSKQESEQHTTFFFRHRLLCDAIYQSMTASLRVELHQHFVNLLLTKSDLEQQGHPGWLALHLEKAEYFELAIQWRLRAAEFSFTRAARNETFDHLDHALSLLPKLSEPQLQLTYELRFQLEKGVVNLFFGDSLEQQAGRAFARCQTLLKENLGTEHKMPALVALLGFHTLRGDTGIFDLIAACEALSASARSSLKPYTDSAIVCTLIFCGRLGEAKRYRERVGKLSWPPNQEDARLRFVQVESFRGHFLVYDWLQGESEQALSMLEELRHFPDTMTRMTPLFYLRLLWLFWFADIAEDREALEEFAQRFERLHAQHQFPTWDPTCRALQAICTLKYRPNIAALTTLEGAIYELRSISHFSMMPHLMMHLALGHEALGHNEDALEVLEEAIVQAERSSLKLYYSEYYRLRGNLLRKDGRLEHAERALVIAWEEAQDGGAELWRMRAALSLASLWHSQSRGAEALTLLTSQVARMPVSSHVLSLVEARRFIAALEAGVEGEA